MMATGYIHEALKYAKEGKPFRDWFYNSFLRAYGVCISLRDSDVKKTPDKFKVSNYHLKERTKAEKELELLNDMTLEEREVYGKKVKEKDMKKWREYIAKDKKEYELLRNYQAESKKMIGILRDVNNKDFVHIIEGLKEQFDKAFSDEDDSYWENELNKSSNKSPLDHYNGKVKSAKWNINYHKKEYKKEVERINDRNKFLKKIIDCLSKLHDLEDESKQKKKKGGLKKTI